MVPGAETVTISSMAVPDFQTIMRPLLALHSDGQEHPATSLRAQLAEQLELTPEDREERLPSGRQPKFDNRVGWATTYLFQTGLLERPRRGVTRVTPRGSEVLEREPERIDLKVLGQFPEFHAFRSTQASPDTQLVGPGQTGSDASAVTPEEAMEAAYGQMRLAIAEELLSRTKEQSPVFFEQLVLDVLHGMGYGGRRRDAGERLGRTGDEGLDGVIREDKLGLDIIYVQAKRWDNTVGRPVIQAFVGALQGARASKGVLITTSTFSSDAQRYADSVSPRVILVDGRELAELMLDHDVGVSRSTQYEIKKIDEDYFAEESTTAVGSAPQVAAALGQDGQASG